MKRITKIEIRKNSTQSREYLAINLVIADLHMSCDLVDARQIILAKRLAESSGIDLLILVPESEFPK